MIPGFCGADKVTCKVPVAASLQLHALMWTCVCIMDTSIVTLSAA